MSGVAVVQTAQRICSFGYRPKAAVGPSARIYPEAAVHNGLPDLLKVPH